MKNSPLVTVLYSNAGSISGPKLAKELVKLGINAEPAGIYNKHIIHHKNTDVLIRFGNTDDFPLKEKSIEINSPKCIRLGSNKSKSRDILQQNEVRVPQSYFSKNDACLMAMKFPLIGRPKNHQHGENIEFIENLKQLEKSHSDYYSEYLPKDKEYRVYLVNFKAVHMAEKIVEDKTQIAWNSHQNGVLVDVFDLENYKEIVDEAIKAARIIGQGFSGVDILLYKNKPYICELNASPALSNKTKLEVITKSFKELIDYYAETGKLKE